MANTFRDKIEAAYMDYCRNEAMIEDCYRERGETRPPLEERFTPEQIAYLLKVDKRKKLN
jgi:hypothetical protein